jgi:hypothetical protein
MAHLISDFDMEVALATAQRMPDQSPNRRILWFSVSVVSQTFGWEWGRNRFFGSSCKDDYLSQHRNPTGGASERLVEVANLIVALRDAEGVGDALNRLQTGNFEQALFELRMAALLKASGLDAKFNTPTGRKGSDFDLLIKLSSGLWVAAEVKYKVSATPLRHGAIWRTLRKAKDQLPGCGTGVIIISLPQSWIQSEDLDEILASDVDRFFRMDRRVYSVMIVMIFTDERGMNYLAHHEFRNDKTAPGGENVFPTQLEIDPDRLFPVHKLIEGSSLPVSLMPLSLVSNPLGDRLKKLKA